MICQIVAIEGYIFTLFLIDYMNVYYMNVWIKCCAQNSRPSSLRPLFLSIHLPVRVWKIRQCAHLVPYH